MEIKSAALIGVGAVGSYFAYGFFYIGIQLLMDRYLRILVKPDGLFHMFLLVCDVIITCYNMFVNTLCLFCII